MSVPEPPTPEQYGFTLDEDSDDFSEAEAGGALVTEDEAALTSLLRAHRCKQEGCGANIQPLAFALRRRKPHLYSRVTVACLHGHRENLVIRTSWVGP